MSNNSEDRDLDIVTMYGCPPPYDDDLPKRTNKRRTIVWVLLAILILVIVLGILL
ncbi:MAG: hypothetical protein IIV55_03355 [Alistipes sp.]|nr:hypothetical protein [Alistipes sp.]